jgi:hypothetical protein
MSFETLDQFLDFVATVIRDSLAFRGIGPSKILAFNVPSSQEVGYIIVIKIDNARTGHRRSHTAFPSFASRKAFASVEPSVLNSADSSSLDSSCSDCLDSANPTVPDAVHYCCFDSPNMGVVSGSRALFSFDSIDSVCFEWVVAAVSRPIRCVVKSSNRCNGRTLSVSSLSFC